MANNSIYTSITEETVTGARDRVLDQLNELTDGQADVAIRYVSEFVELDNILEEHKKRKAEEKHASDAMDAMRYAVESRSLVTEPSDGEEYIF